MKGFCCRRCGKVHDELPMHYGAPAPELWFRIPEAERPRRCDLTSDQCVIDEQHFFIVGNVDIAVAGQKEHFSWDVWVSLSEKNFLRACQLWKKKGRESEPPYFGWLQTVLPGYPNTLSLKTHVHTRVVGRRPYVELEATDHPLAIEQRDGINLARVQEIAELVLHGKA